MYDWVQSTKVISLDMGVYEVRWGMLNGHAEHIRLDCFDLVEVPSPTRKATWGTIRLAFR